MGEAKQINIKNRTYYFYSDQINLKDFDASLLKVVKKKLQGDWPLLHPSAMWLFKKLLIVIILTVRILCP